MTRTEELNELAQDAKRRVARLKSTAPAEPTIQEVNAIRIQGDAMDAEKLAALLKDDSLCDGFGGHTSNESFLIGLEIGMRLQAARVLGGNNDAK